MPPRRSVVSNAPVYRNGLRPGDTTYPLVSGAHWSQGYGANNSIDDRLNRTASHTLFDGNLGPANRTHPVALKYNGLGRVTEITSASSAANVSLKRYLSASPNEYTGFDRFGRLAEQRWTLGNTSVDHFQFSYDHASNLLTRDNVLKSTQDRIYTFDGLNQLQSSGESDSSKNRYWELDQLGNQQTIRQGLTATSAVLEARSHNEANELVGFSVPSGQATPVHDAAGNMTTIPKPKNLSAGYAAVYDAWNRLVSLGGGSDASYRYDGLNRRISRFEKGKGTTHFYYNERSQVLTEANGPTVATAIYSYHPNYVDSVAVRMRSNDEHFFTHDHQFSVTAAIEVASNPANNLVAERYNYSAYGEVSFLVPATYAAKSVTSSEIGVEYLYTGRRLDPVAGLQLNRNRYYHAKLGRWINRDPAGYVDGKNLYGAYFVPRGMDPSGKTEIPDYPDTLPPHSPTGHTTASGDTIFQYDDSNPPKCIVKHWQGPPWNRTFILSVWPCPDGPPKPEPPKTTDGLCPAPLVLLRGMCVRPGTSIDVFPPFPPPIEEPPCDEDESCDCWCVGYQNGVSIGPTNIGMMTKKQCLANSFVKTIPDTGESYEEICACGAGWWK